VTEAQALAEFESQEELNEAFDYSWSQGLDENCDEIPTLRRPNGNVVIRGDHDCDEVACDESVFEFEIELTGDEVAAISSGEEITKQLLAGSVQTGTTEELLEPIFEQVYRTVKLRVSTVS
jgi:hypothetical protein